MLTVSDLCAKALNYLKTIDVKNKPNGFSPSSNYYSYLQPDKELQSYTHTGVMRGHRNRENWHWQWPSKNMTVKMCNSSIDSAYRAATSDSAITQDWNSFKSQCIDTKLNPNEFVSVTSLLTFMYLFKYFVDRKFHLFSDVFVHEQVWLYNTSSVSYSPSNISVNTSKLTTSNVLTAFNTLINEIVNSNTYSAISVYSQKSTSCSSSSCSSSCCSSSCSSSSFIIYFNLQ